MTSIAYKGSEAESAALAAKKAGTDPGAPPIFTTSPTSGDTVPSKAPFSQVQALPDQTTASAGPGAPPSAPMKPMSPTSMAQPGQQPVLKAGGGMAYDDPNNTSGYWGRSAGTAVAFNGAAVRRASPLSNPRAGATPAAGPGAPPAPPSPATSGRIDPSNDLRSQVLTTSDSARTGRFAGMTDAAAVGLPADLAGDARRFGDEEFARFGNTDVNAGDDIDYGPSVQGELDANDAMTQNLVGRATGRDRGALSRSSRAEFSDFLRPEDLQGGPSIAARDSSRVGRYGQMTDDAAGQLAAVDRFKLAQDKLREWNDSTKDLFDSDLKNATAKAAAQGQGRSGMLRTDYGNLTDRRASQRNAMERSLLTDALEGTIGDQFRKTDTLRGLESGISGQEANLRGEARTERGYGDQISRENIAARQRAKEQAAGMGESAADATMAGDRASAGLAMDRGSQLSGREAVRRSGLASNRAIRTAVQEGNVGRRLSARQAATATGMDLARTNADNGYRRLSTAADLEGMSRGIDAGKTAEARGERDYENSMENQAFQRRLLQHNQEQQDQAFAQNQALQLLGAGEAGNPADVLEQLSKSGIDPSVVADLAASIGARGGSATPTKGSVDTNALNDILNGITRSTRPRGGY